MKTKQIRRVAAVAIALCVCGGVVYRLAVAAPPAPEAGNGTENESLDVRYARAVLALAQANLNRVQAMNNQFAKSVSADVVSGYQQDVDMAKLSLKLAQSGAESGPFESWLQRAKSDAAVAEAQWRSTAAAAKASAGSVSTTDVERLRLWYELDKLAVERGQAVAHGTADQRLEWELSLVGNELQRMRDELRRTAGGNSAFPTGN